MHVFDLIENTYRKIKGGGKHSFKCPTGIDSDVMGRVYVVDSCADIVLVYDADLSFSRALPDKSVAPALDRPWAIVVSPDGKRLYLSEPALGQVVVLNQEGEAVQRITNISDSQPLGMPTALAIDGQQKELFVLDMRSRGVEVFTLGGTYLRSIRWQNVKEPTSIAFDSVRGLFFVGDQRFDTTLVFDKRGASVGAFGQSGADLGQLHAPSTLYVDRDRVIYWVDSFNRKVLVFGETAVIAPDLGY